MLQEEKSQLQKELEARRWVSRRVPAMRQLCRRLMSQPWTASWQEGRPTQRFHGDVCCMRMTPSSRPYQVQKRPQQSYDIGYDMSAREEA